MEKRGMTIAFLSVLTGQIQSCSDVRRSFVDAGCCPSSSSSLERDFFAATGKVRLGFSPRGGTRALADTSRDTIVTVRKLWGYDHDVLKLKSFEIDEATGTPYYDMPVIVAEHDAPHEFQRPTRQCTIPGTMTADSLTTDDGFAYVVEVNDNGANGLRLFRVPLPVQSDESGNCQHDSMQFPTLYGRTTDITSVGDYIVLLTRQDREVGGYEGVKKMPIFTKIAKADFGDASKIQQKMGSSQMPHSYYSTYAISGSGDHVFAMGAINLDSIDVTKDWNVTNMTSERIPFFNPDATQESIMTFQKDQTDAWMSTFAHSSHHTYAARAGDSLSGCSYLYASTNFVSWFSNQLTKIDVPSQNVTDPEWRMPGTKGILKVCEAQDKSGVEWDYCVFDKNPKWGTYVESYTVDDATGEIYIAGHNALTTGIQGQAWEQKLGASKLYGTPGVAKAHANWETHVCTMQVDAFFHPADKQAAESFHTFRTSPELPDLNSAFYAAELKPLVPDEVMFKGYTGLRLSGEKLYAYGWDMVAEYDRATLEREPGGLVVPVYGGSHSVTRISSCDDLRDWHCDDPCHNSNASQMLSTKALLQPATRACRAEDSVKLTLRSFHESAVSFGDGNWLSESVDRYCAPTAGGCLTVYYGSAPPGARDDYDNHVSVEYRGSEYDLGVSYGTSRMYRVGPACAAR